MHETYRILAQQQIDERLREAADWRRADEARRGRPRRALAGRIRAWLPHGRDQRPRPAPTGSALAGDGAGCA